MRTQGRRFESRRRPFFCEAPTRPCDGTHAQGAQRERADWDGTHAASVAMGARGKGELALARCSRRRARGALPAPAWEPRQWAAADWGQRHKAWDIRHCAQSQRAPSQCAASPWAFPHCAPLHWGAAAWAPSQWHPAHWEAPQARDAAHWEATSNEWQTAHAGLGRCAARWEQHHPGGSTPTELGATAHRTLPGAVLLSASPRPHVRSRCAK